MSDPINQDPSRPPIDVTGIVTLSAYKQQVKVLALSTAINLKPQPIWDSSKGGLVDVPYSVLEQADLIYNWLIKDL